MKELIDQLICEVLELCDSSVNAKRKELWIKHNNLENSDQLLFNLHLWKMQNHSVWREIIPDGEIKSIDPDQRLVERQLKQKLYKFNEIDDDDIILPAIWLEPIIEKAEPAFGLEPDIEAPEEILGSKKYKSIINNTNDLKRLNKPNICIDKKKTDERILRIREITGDKLQIKIILPQIGTSPFELVAKFRSTEDLLFDFYDNPEIIHAMMEFFTGCIIYDYKRLERNYGIDPESTWDFRVHYDKIEKPDMHNSLDNCWAYISAQSAAVISPEMFEEFVQPYHRRIAEIFGKVYYHGCEDLTRKAGIIGQLPNLRRFHISPWSNVDSILDELGSSFVYEVHVHPANHLFIYDDAEIKQDIKKLGLKCIERGVTADINLSDIETVNKDQSKLIRWAKLAREAVNSI